MPLDSYELTRLDTKTFEHLANSLALHVLGSGHTMFGPGKDGGRDGYFEGTAPYPSTADQWSGRWYIQSKFHAPHLSKDHHDWLVEQVSSEIKEFSKPQTKRIWPDNLIIVTNIDPSGVPHTGAYDRARAIVEAARPELTGRFHIWGGKKVLDLLQDFPNVANAYFELISSGAVLKSLYDNLVDIRASSETVMHNLVAKRFSDQQYTKLEQAGSAADNRPSIQSLFVDIPFRLSQPAMMGMAADVLTTSLAEIHSLSQSPSEAWGNWHLNPKRARSWFVKGGPGQGKSTLTQFVAQIHRAAILLAENAPPVRQQVLSAADDVKNKAVKHGLWPISPRIPFTIELKEFAYWYGKQKEETPKLLLTYMAHTLSREIGEEVTAGSLKRMFEQSRWMFVFDGLDEVPAAIKTGISNEIIGFVDNVLLLIASDAVVICTSRPQGYSGQFDELDAAEIDLQPLSPEQALACATPLLKLDRSEEESHRYIRMLENALQNSAVAEIMTTPLQSHIMSIIVRDGGPPPERKWQLYNTFYQVIKKRESNKNFPDEKISKILREGDLLLRALHNRLGFELHRLAETADGAATSMSRQDLRVLMTDVVSDLQDRDVAETVETLMEATTERLVLVNTPESKDFVRFDVRPLQEFFAAEYIYSSGAAAYFPDRIRLIVADSHWREVMHFLVSALVEENRRSEIAETISELVSIDGASDENRALQRRLARGGCIAARLLSEGVLEQDKRVRNQFLPCLGPLFASCVACSALGYVSSVHTRRWLFDAEINCVNEATENESIGAASALLMMQDNDEKAEVAFETLRVKSLPYLVAAVRLAFAETLVPLQRTTLLITKISCHMLLSPAWRNLGDEIGLLYHIISNCDLQSRAFVELGLPQSAELISKCLSGNSYTDQQEVVDEREEQGPLIIDYLQQIDILPVKDWKDEAVKELIESSGAARAIGLAAFAIQCGKREVIEEFLIFIGGFHRIELLPEYMKTYFSTDCIKSNGDIDLDLVLNRKHPGQTARVSISFKGEITRPDLMRICLSMPSWIVYHIRENSSVALIDQIANDNDVADIFLLGLRRLSAPGLWFSLIGLISNANEGLGASLRRLALERADEELSTMWAQREILPFRLALPLETPLLPHVLRLSLSRIGSFPMTRARSRKDAGANTKSARALINGFIDDSVDLIELTKGERDIKIRLAALALHFLRRSDDFMPSPFDEEMIVSSYAGEHGDLFLPSISLFLLGLADRNAETAFRILNRVLEKAARDLPGRIALETDLETIREYSISPLSASYQRSVWT